MVAFIISLYFFWPMSPTKNPPSRLPEHPIQPPISQVPYFVRSVSVSDDNMLVVGAGDGGKLSVFSLQKRKAIYYSRTPGNREIRAVSFLPNSHIIVTIGHSQILYWDVDAKKVIGKIPIEAKPFSAKFSFDRRYIAICSNTPKSAARVVIYDIQKKELLANFHISISIWEFSWSRDSKSLLFTTLTGQKTIIYEVRNGVEKEFSNGKQREQAVVHVDPYSNIICWGLEDFRLRFFDVESKTVKGHVKYPKGIESDIDFSPNNRLFAMVGCDGVVHLYDNKTYKHLGTSQRLHKDIIWDVQFSPNNNFIVTGGDDGKMNIIRVDEILGKEK